MSPLIMVMKILIGNTFFFKIKAYIEEPADITSILVKEQSRLPSNPIQLIITRVDKFLKNYPPSRKPWFYTKYITGIEIYGSA